LGRLGNVESFQPLIALFRGGKMTEEFMSGEGHEQMLVARTIRNLGNTEALPLLITMFKDEDEFIRESASLALKQLGISITEETESWSEEISLNSLVNSLTASENIHAQRQAIKTLEKLLEADRLPPPKQEKVTDALGQPPTVKMLETLATPTTIQGDKNITVHFSEKEIIWVVTPQKLTTAEKTEIQAKLAEIVQNPQTIFGVRADALRAIAQLRTPEVAQLIS